MASRTRLARGGTKCCTPLSLERSPALTSMTYIARPPVGTRSVSPIAPRTSHAWRHFNRHTAIRLRVSGEDFVRPGRGHDTNRDCSSSPMAMPIRRRRPLGAASRNRSGIEIVMSPLPMLRLNTRIDGSDSTPTTAFTGPRRCRFRTSGATTATSLRPHDTKASAPVLANLETRSRADGSASTSAQSDDQRPGRVRRSCIAPA